MIGAELQGRYRLEAEIGRGGMGVVYAARDLLLDREVAVKLLLGEAWGAEGRARLLREARAAARLNHPHIVGVYDAGEAPVGQTSSDAIPYIVMELVRGISLRDLISGQAVPIDTVVAIGRQLCEALEHAHTHGVVHRDLKPENVLLLPASGAGHAGGYTAKLTDFGLARARGTDSLTREGNLVGTVYYLAPEQALSSEVDGRADLYALGVVLYESVTGRVPFHADDPLTVISQHLHVPPVPPHAYRPDLPAPLESTILTLLAKEPEQRFSSAAAAGRALAAPPAAVQAQRLLDPRVALLDRLARGVLVGREEELRQLQDLWALTRGGRAHLVLLSGEPGVGKTRLAQELIVHARLTGATVLSGACYEHETGTPYLPVREAVGNWLHQLGDDELRTRLGPAASELAALVPEIGHRLGPLPPMPALSPQEERLRLFDAIARLLETCAQPKGLVLFIDDLQWADQGTLGFLQYVLRYLRQAPLLALGTYREVELDRAHPLAAALVEWNRQRLATRLALHGLTLQETQSMLRALLDEEDVTGEFAAAIFKETEGNPFFVEEVIKSLIEQGQVYWGDAGWQRQEIGELSIPQSVRETIGRRLDRLSSECAEVLHIAAVLGKNFRFEELVSVAAREEGQLLDALDEATAAQLVQPAREDSFAFMHDNIREVLYDEMNIVRRRRLHKRVGEALEKLYAADPGSHVQPLANHFLRGGDLQRGLQYSLQAGKAAEKLAALDEAVHYYQQALECAEAIGDRQALVDIHVALSRVYILRGPKSEAVEHAAQALHLAEEVAPERTPSLKARLGNTYISYGEAEGRAWLEEAIRELNPEREGKDLAMAIASLGRFYHYKGQHRRAVEYAQQARVVAEPLDDPEVLVIVYGYLAGAYQHLAQMAESKRWARCSIDLGDRHSYPFASATGHEFMAEDAYMQGLWQEAMVHAEADREIGRRVGSMVRIGWAELCRTWSFFGQGDLAHAAEAGRAGTDMAERSGDQRLRILVESVLSLVQLELGDMQDARHLAEAALQRANETGQALLQSEAWRSLCEVQLRCGQAEAVLEEYRRRVAALGDSDSALTRNHLAHVGIAAWLALEYYEEVEPLLQERLAWAQTAGMGRSEVILLTDLGRLMAGRQRWDESEAAFEQAIAQSEALASRLQLAHALAARAEMWKARGRSAEASGDLEQATAVFQACGVNHPFAA